MGRLSDEWKYDELKPRPAKDREKAAKKIASLPYEEAVKEMEKLHSEFNINDHNDISRRVMEKTKGNPDNYGKKLDYEVVNDKSIDAIKDNFTPPGAKGEKKRRIVATDNPNWKWDNEDIARRFMAIPLVGGAYENNDPETAKEYYKQLKKMPIEELVNERDLANTMRFEGEDEPEWAKEKDNEVLNPTYSSLFGSEAPYANMESILDEWDKEDVKDAIDTNDNGKIEVDEMADFQKSLDDYASKNKKGRDDIPVTTRR